MDKSKLDQDALKPNSGWFGKFMPDTPDKRALLEFDQGIQLLFQAMQFGSVLCVARLRLS